MHKDKWCEKKQRWGRERKEPSWRWSDNQKAAENGGGRGGLVEGREERRGSRGGGVLDTCREAESAGQQSLGPTLSLCHCLDAPGRDPQGSHVLQRPERLPGP